MPVILSAIAVALALALLAGSAFYLAQEPVYRAQPMPGVRVGDPGYNLVGREWTGNPPRTQSSNPSSGTAEDGEAAQPKSGPAG